MTSITLAYNDLAIGGTSDKVYSVQIAKQGSGFTVNFQFGRRGGTMNPGTKTPAPVAQDEAERIFARLVAEKTGKGYKPVATKNTAMQTAPVDMRASGFIARNDPDAMEAAIARDSARTKYPVELLDEIGREQAERLLTDSRYWMQVKVDGVRRQVQKTEAGIIGFNKRGERVLLPAEIADELARINLESFVFDGELVGNSYIAFDCLMAKGVSLAKESYETRFDRLRGALKNTRKALVSLVPTWMGTASKQAALAALFQKRAEGVAYKLRTAPYRAGVGSHSKFKFVKTVSAYVTAIGVGGKSNAAIALQDRKGNWREVAHVSTIGKGQIAVGDVLEISFLYATQGNRLYQPRVKEIRTDVLMSECTFTRQLKPEFYKEGIAA